MTQEEIKEAYVQYWDTVKNFVDENGWVYSKESPHILDYYFEVNTGKSIEFQKSYEGKWRGTRWRPKELCRKEQNPCT